MSKPGTMVYTILDRAVQFFQEPKNRERIQQNCLDPMLRYILDRMFPYIILTCILFSLILLMSLTSVGLLMFQLHMSSRITQVGNALTANAASVAANAVSSTANAVSSTANAVSSTANAVSSTANAVSDTMLNQVLL
jgi:hypothetical protein